MAHIYKRPNGTVALDYIQADMSDEQKQQHIQRMIASFEPGTVYVGEGDPPSNRRFRSCWSHGTSGVVVDMAKARAQRMEEIRIERNSLLKKTDVDLLVSQERGTEKEIQDIKTVRQALRDLPQSIDLSLVATPEQLESFTPVWPGINA